MLRTRGEKKKNYMYPVYYVGPNLSAARLRDDTGAPGKGSQAGRRLYDTVLYM